MAQPCGSEKSPRTGGVGPPFSGIPDGWLTAATVLGTLCVILTVAFGWPILRSGEHVAAVPPILTAFGAVLMMFAAMLMLDRRCQRKVSEVRRLQRNLNEAMKDAEQHKELIAAICSHLGNPGADPANQDPIASSTESDLAVPTRVRVRRRSAHELAALAESVQAVSGIWSARGVSRVLPVTPDRLVNHLTEVLERSCVDAGAAFRIVRPASMHRSLNIDISRIAFAVDQLALYLISGERGGRLIVRIDHDGYMLKLRLDAGRGAPLAQDQADEIYLRLAREFVRSLGGSLMLKPDRCCIQFNVPAPLILNDPNLVVLQTSSETHRLSMRTALLGTPCEEWGDGDDPARVCAVLFDISSTGVAAGAGQWRKRFPRAQHLAIGNREPEGRFDGVCELPLDLPDFEAKISAAHRHLLARGLDPEARLLKSASTVSD